MILITGGLGQNNLSSFALASAELYDPVTGLFASQGTMSASTYWHTATLLNNGDTLIAGGDGSSPSFADLYLPNSLIPIGLVSIAVSPSALTLPIGATQQFVAIGTFGDGSRQTLQSVTWTSSNQNVATITNDATNQGVGLGLSAGQTIITASLGSISGSIMLTVQ
jgi:trimeric autotransporter adhesin